MKRNIMPMFKVQEPFMDVLDNGYGYQGVMMRDINDDTLQCHVCGKWYRGIGNHARILHRLSAKEYKLKYGLPLGLGMVSTSTSAAHSKRVRQQNETMQESPLIKAQAVLEKKRHMLRKINKPLMLLQGRKSMAFKNKHGLCDSQIMGRYQVVKTITKEHPTIPQLEQYDRTLYGAIRRRFGNLEEFRRKNKFKMLANHGSRYEDIELIACLREWSRKNRRTPTFRAFNSSRNGYQAHAATILEHFGSWRAALQVAGLR